MPRLNDLCLNLLHDREFGHRLGTELLRQHLVLPVVKKIQYGFDLCRMTPGVTLMQKAFPELDALHLNVGHQSHDVSLDELFCLSSLNLKTISLRKPRWEFEHVSEIHDFFPDVTKLILSGNIDHELMISVGFFISSCCLLSLVLFCPNSCISTVIELIRRITGIGPNLRAISTTQGSGTHGPSPPRRLGCGCYSR